MLAGAHRLHTTQPATRWGQTLLQHSDRWYPWVLFSWRIFFTLLFFLLLWKQLLHVGFTLTPLTNICFFILLLLIPLKSLTKEFHIAYPDEKGRCYITDNLFRTLLICCITLFMTSVLTSFSNPHPALLPGTQIDAINVILWIVCTIILLVSLLQFAGRLPRHQPEPVPKKRTTPPNKSTY